MVYAPNPRPNTSSAGVISQRMYARPDTANNSRPTIITLRPISAGSDCCSGRRLRVRMAVMIIITSTPVPK